MNWKSIREEFPALNTCTYLNTATFGQVSNRSRKAMERHFEQRNEHAALDFTGWFDDMNAIRESIGGLVGCGGEDIAFIQNASTALSLMMAGVRWKSGDQILTMEGEFPNQLYYASHLAARGVELVVVPCEELLEHVTERTRLVTISTVSYSNGYVAPVKEIGEVLRRRGILFYLDGTQSVGALQIDLRSIQPDLFAVHGYKWMISPHGAGFMYVSPALRAKLDPAVIGWRSDYAWRSVNALNQGAPRFSETAEKYEGGMLNFSALYALGESIQMMREIGVSAIEERVLDLANQVRQTAEAHGARVLHGGSSVVAICFPERDAALLATQLKQQGIIAAARHGNLRISPHFYNNEEDIGRFSEALHRLM